MNKLRKRRSKSRIAQPTQELPQIAHSRRASWSGVADALRVPYDAPEEAPYGRKGSSVLTKSYSVGHNSAWSQSTASVYSHHRPGTASTFASSTAGVTELLYRGRLDVAHRSTLTPGSPRERSRAQPPTFNVLLVGKRNSGKSSFIRTLLKTVELAPGQGHDEAVERLDMSEKLAQRRTTVPSSITVDIMERGERLQISLHDTPGLDSLYADELEADRNLTAILDSIEAKFQETLQQESQVVRSSVRHTDQHIHCCLYFILPSSFTTEESRREKEPYTPPMTPVASPKALSKAKSSPQLNGRSPPEQNSDADASLVETPSTEAGDPMQTFRVKSTQMSTLDLRLIKRLRRRVNVIPIIARADELTSSRLAELKAAVSRDLRREGLGFGVLDHNSTPTNVHPNGFRSETPPPPPLPENAAQVASLGLHGSRLESPIKVIRTRSRTKSLSRSRTKPLVIEDSEPTPDTAALQELMPFAIISPEDFSHQGLKRVFKWGTIDILNPEHCDVQPLTRVILQSHMKTLKESTRKKLYERFRTERLLARRRTALPKNDRDALLQDLEKI